MSSPSVASNPGPRKLGRDAKILIGVGARIIPVGANKVPLWRWRKYRTVEPTVEEIAEWCRDPRTAGWAVLTGPVSGGAGGGWLTIDVETPGMAYPQIIDPLKALPRTSLRRTQHRGAHAHILVYDAPDDWDWGGHPIAKVKSLTDKKTVLLVEYRGDGQYAVVTGPERPELPEDFSPHPVSVETFEQLIAGGRALHDPTTSVHKAITTASAGAAAGVPKKQVKGDTGDVLRQAVVEQPDVWPLLLDPGWTVIGVYPRYWQNKNGVWEDRVTLQRPGKDSKDEGESANALGPVLVNFSTSVDWWPEDKIGKGLGAMQAVAAAWFAGDYRVACTAAEAAAENLVLNGIAPDPASAFAAWPPELLEEVHTARKAADDAWRHQQATGGMGAPAAEGLPPDEADEVEEAETTTNATVTSLHAVGGTGKASADASLEDAEYHKQLRMARARRRVDRTLADEDSEAMRATRKVELLADLAALPPLEEIMDEVLAVEMNLLGGPSEAGKSLLARDWALAVASGQPWRGHMVSKARPVLWVASEGTHDLAMRWTNEPLWKAAADKVYLLPDPVMLISPADVDWLLTEFAVVRPGLVVFDVIYGMGMADDDGSKDVIPVTNAMKRISSEWGAATLALGHPGHNTTGRRFRGSSSWRQLTAVEWHMADETLTCEKSKIADKSRLSATYKVEYPDIVWTSTAQVLGSTASRTQTIIDDIASHPNDSDRKRAMRLAPAMGLSEGYVRRLIAQIVGGAT